MNLQGAIILIKLAMILVISLSWVVKTRFHVLDFLRVSFHVSCFAHHIIVGEAAYMKPNPKSPTSVIISS
jgi:hypothetical protein